MKPLLTGALLDGRYRLERMIARGGMSEVWSARHSLLDRRVAVKFITVDSAAARALVLDEARLLATLRHPAIVTVYDCGVHEESVPYLVMELVSGRTLRQQLEQRGPLDARHAASLVAWVARGAHAAHEAHVIHRDIKPDNILLDDPSSLDHAAAKLVDFGISQRAERTSAALRFSGTPAYMAPEQIRGEPADRLVDVWALGVTLYELVQGSPPFGDQNVTDTMTAALDGVIPYPRAAKGVDGALWRIITDALRVDRALRTPSALALADSLEQWLDRRRRAIETSPTLRHVQSSAASSTDASNTHTISNTPHLSVTASDASTPTLDQLILERLTKS